MSPLLSNLVADALSALLDKAVQKNRITGIVADLFQGGISRSQYADDTVIMTDDSEQSVINLNLILYSFEWLSGLKIIFHKSDVFVFGMEQSEQERLANTLNYKLGGRPLRYLGAPISDSKLGISAFGALKQKMTKGLFR